MTDITRSVSDEAGFEVQVMVQFCKGLVALPFTKLVLHLDKLFGATAAAAFSRN
jgi:hypothetical protein